MSRLSDRRTFVRAALAGALGLAPGLRPAARAIGPIKRTGKPRLALSLAAYSYTRFLSRGGKKGTMALEDVIDIAGKLKLPAVELTAYYFPKTTPEYLREVKARCTRLGLAVSGTAVGNDFCVKDPKKLAAQIDMVKRWTEHTAALGGKTMRIFAGSVKKGDTEAEARKRCVEAITRACDHAAQHKVYLALENHGGITGTAGQLLAIVGAVEHDWFGVNLDTGNFHTADPYADLAKAAPYAVTVQVKTEVYFGKKKQPADLKRVTDILRRANYQGYVALEYEAAEDPRTAVPKAIAELKKYMG
jgi:sugar phosphate isomerase/epimerase